MCTQKRTFTLPVLCPVREGSVWDHLSGLTRPLTDNRLIWTFRPDNRLIWTFRPVVFTLRENIKAITADLLDNHDKASETCRNLVNWTFCCRAGTEISCYYASK
ncbi:hypothetical protein DPMN_178146 [Dreissena polymorpha]|uniref:Uncharacterized protein n=1 Tax=Dreissena polymorpha TaxID=45954 RepID=A0A9D4ECU6_DREPO|nr:hypothetical protein DPMN_178146 [Dreissena polymorpha]